MPAIRRRIDMRRMVALYAVNEDLAIRPVIRRLHEVPDEIDAEAGNPRVRWDP